MYATVSATLKGLPTIRAFGAQPRFHAQLLAFAGANMWGAPRGDLRAGLGLGKLPGSRV